MTYEEIMQAAREATEGKCSVCRECDGRVCADRIPGPGSIGDVAARNFSTWREIRLNMDTLTDVKSVDTSVRLFGRTFSLPVFAGPVGAVALHYGKKYDDAHYNDILVRSCAESGICAFTGDGVLIARPFVTAVYGGGDEGVKMYIARLRRGLEDAMTMCGAADIASISRYMIRI